MLLMRCNSKCCSHQPTIYLVYLKYHVGLKNSYNNNFFQVFIFESSLIDLSSSLIYYLTKPLLNTDLLPWKPIQCSIQADTNRWSLSGRTLFSFLFMTKLLNSFPFFQLKSVQLICYRNLYMLYQNYF